MLLNVAECYRTVDVPVTLISSTVVAEISHTLIQIRSTLRPPDNVINGQIWCKIAVDLRDDSINGSYQFAAISSSVLAVRNLTDFTCII